MHAKCVLCVYVCERVCEMRFWPRPSQPRRRTHINSTSKKSLSTSRATFPCCVVPSCHSHDFNTNASRRIYRMNRSHIDFPATDYLDGTRLEVGVRATCGGVIVSFFVQLFIENLQVISNKNRRQRFTAWHLVCTKYSQQTAKLRFSHRTVHTLILTHTHTTNGLGHAIPTPCRRLTRIATMNRKRFECVWQSHVCQCNRVHVVKRM